MRWPDSLHRRWHLAENDDEEGRNRTKQEREQAPHQAAPPLALSQPRVDEGEGSPADEEVGAVVYQAVVQGRLSLGSGSFQIQSRPHAIPNPPEFGFEFGVGTLSGFKIIKNN